MISRSDLIVPDWPAPSGVRAAFTLRTGGVSVGPYASLNLGAHVGDAPEAVAENRRQLRELLSLPMEPAWLEQVHGAEVVNLDDTVNLDHGAALQRDPRALLAKPFARADASVTRETGCVCVIQVADCMPVLFAALDGSAIGAAHAGWRGLSSGVLEATVRSLDVAPRELIAWMGPSIGPAHFEVGGEVREAFMAHDPAAGRAFMLNDRGRWQCDLYALARQRLESSGVRSVHGGGGCTFTETERFFSYRRDGQCGRMAALIWRAPGDA